MLILKKVKIWFEIKWNQMISHKDIQVFLFFSNNDFKLDNSNNSSKLSGYSQNAHFQGTIRSPLDFSHSGDFQSENFLKFWFSSFK